MPDEIPIPPQTQFVPGQQVVAGAYRWWVFPVDKAAGGKVANLVMQGPGGDSHFVLEPDDLIKFGAWCIQQAKAIKNTTSKLVVPDVQVPPDLLRPNGQEP